MLPSTTLDTALSSGETMSFNKDIVCIILYVIALVIPHIQICYISFQNRMNYDTNLYIFYVFL